MRYAQEHAMKCKYFEPWRKQKRAAHHVISVSRVKKGNLTPCNPPKGTSPVVYTADETMISVSTRSPLTRQHLPFREASAECIRNLLLCSLQPSGASPTSVSLPSLTSSLTASLSGILVSPSTFCSFSFPSSISTSLFAAPSPVFA